MFPLVSTASIPAAHTVTTQPLSGFIILPSRWLFRNVFTATLWNQSKHTCKKPVLFNFLSLEIFFLIFYHFFFSGKELPCCSCYRKHLAPGREKNNPACFTDCHSWSKWSYDIRRAKTAIPWKAPKPHRQCQELNHNPR